MADNHVRLQQDRAPGPAKAVCEIEVLRGLERATAAENLIKTAQSQKRSAPRCKVGAHSEDTKAVTHADPPRCRDGQCGDHSARGALVGNHWFQNLAVDEVDVRIGLEGGVDLAQPIGRRHTVVVGEGDQMVARLTDAAVVGAG